MRTLGDNRLIPSQLGKESFILVTSHYPRSHFLTCHYYVFHSQTVTRSLIQHLPLQTSDTSCSISRWFKSQLPRYHVGIKQLSYLCLELALIQHLPLQTSDTSCSISRWFKSQLPRYYVGIKQLSYLCLELARNTRSKSWILSLNLYYYINRYRTWSNQLRRTDLQSSSAMIIPTISSMVQRANQHYSWIHIHFPMLCYNTNLLINVFVYSFC